VAAGSLLVIALYYLGATGQVPVGVQEQTYVLSTKVPALVLGINLVVDVLSQEWLLNAFLLVNALLALLLFDKLVLKPFFQKKRQTLAG